MKLRNRLENVFRINYSIPGTYFLSNYYLEYFLEYYSGLVLKMNNFFCYPLLIVFVHIFFVKEHSITNLLLLLLLLL